MSEINWKRFEIKNHNPQNAFETMCRNIFLRAHKVSSHNFSANYNQAGLETEPVLCDGKYYGFQCKYSTSGNSNTMYAEVLDSLTKAVEVYPKLNIVVIYTNLDIKPNVSKVDLLKPKKTNRVKIYELCKDNGVDIIWFVKPNFEAALNDIGNYDLYRSFFSPEDTLGLLKSSLTHDDRTFLMSDQFIDLSLNGSKFSAIKEDIISKGNCIITGAAGTGKSEILKSLYLQSENQYLESINQVTPNNDTPIPVFVRLRECVNGNLEDLLRNRLKDFDINVSNGSNHYLYFFDGLDEVSSLDIGAVLNCLMHLKDQVSTRTMILTSRLNTPNLTTILRDFKPIVYTVDPLESSDVDEYFRCINNPKKQEKLQEIKDRQFPFYEDITDIFSLVLLSEIIFEIDDTTTKVDLIRKNAERLIEGNCKCSLINLPEPKMLCIERILAKVSELMQRTGNISVSRIDLQNIIGELFPNCNYLEVDEIVDFVSEMFFDSSSSQPLQKRYAYRHKRYFEFYLYCFIKDVFYENPSILRELRLLSNKDFILNVFLVQELKNNTINNNVQHVLTLRFFEAYLGEEYLRDAGSSFLKSNAPSVSGVDAYLQSYELREYLCTKDVEDLRDFLINDPLSISGFLTLDNYYSFVKEYHKAKGIDVREILEQVYDIKDEWMKKAAEKDQSSYLYCKCIIEQVSISEVFGVIPAIDDMRTIDLDYYSYKQSDINIVIGFFELAIDYFYEWLLSIMNNLSTQHLEVLSYILLRTNYLPFILKSDGKTPLTMSFVERVSADEAQQYGIHTIVLYGLLTGTLIQKGDIQARSEQVNIYHYETWRNNFELNNYTALTLGEEFKPYHPEYKLGIALRQIVHNYYPDKKTELLSAILQEVNRYNLIYKKPFSYNNAVFIGECIASLNVNSDDLKRFVIELRKFDSVVSLFQILYTVMQRNPGLFRIISNPSLLDLEYDKACHQPSYYDHNTDLGFKYATMISYFDLSKADALFESAINNSIFRPIFRNENMLDYHLSCCLLTAYENYWLSSDEFEDAVRRTVNMLKIAKETLDSGADGEYCKYLIEQCCPHLSDIVQDFKVDANNPERLMGWESKSSTVPVDSITIDNLPQYYCCTIDGINYSSVSVWKELIGFEFKNDENLTVLYQTLEKNLFPGSLTNMGSCFHVLVAVLILNPKTKHKAIKFVMEHTGRMGLVYLIKAFALIGDDRLGCKYIEQLISLCEAMVYPSAKYTGGTKMHNRRAEQIIEIVINSEMNDWDEDSELPIMYYVPDPKITIKWDRTEEPEPFNEEWAIKHPDKNAKYARYYVCYDDKTINIVDMVSVDGGRALIPVPARMTNHISRSNYMIGRLLNWDLDNYNDYIIRSGLIVD